MNLKYNLIISGEDMYMSGKRGKALKILHCIGDQLWIHFGKLELPELGVPENLEFLNEKLEELGDDKIIMGNRAAIAPIISDDENENDGEASNESNEENKIEESGHGADEIQGINMQCG